MLLHTASRRLGYVLNKGAGFGGSGLFRSGGLRRGPKDRFDAGDIHLSASGGQRASCDIEISFAINDDNSCKDPRFAGARRK
jgi:hypothetical protein